MSWKQLTINIKSNSSSIFVQLTMFHSCALKISILVFPWESKSGKRLMRNCETDKSYLFKIKRNLIQH